MACLHIPTRIAFYSLTVLLLLAHTHLILIPFSLLPDDLVSELLSNGSTVYAQRDAPAANATGKEAIETSTITTPRLPCSSVGAVLEAWGVCQSQALNHIEQLALASRDEMLLWSELGQRKEIRLVAQCLFGGRNEASRRAMRILCSCLEHNVTLSLPIAECIGVTHSLILSLREWNQSRHGAGEEGAGPAMGTEPGESDAQQLVDEAADLLSLMTYLAKQNVDCHSLVCCPSTRELALVTMVKVRQLCEYQTGSSFDQVIKSVSFICVHTNGSSTNPPLVATTERKQMSPTEGSIDTVITLLQT